jgi:hypothetical protein
VSDYDYKAWAERAREVSKQQREMAAGIEAIMAMLTDENALRFDALLRVWIIQAKCGSCGQFFLCHTLVSNDTERWLAPASDTSRRCVGQVPIAKVTPP